MNFSVAKTDTGDSYLYFKPSTALWVQTEKGKHLLNVVQDEEADS